MFNRLGFFLIMIFSVISCKKEVETINEMYQEIAEDSIVEEPLYGFQLKNFKVERDTIKRGDNLSLLMARNGLDATNIHEISKNIGNAFDMRKMKVGKTLTILKGKEAPYPLQYIVYQASPQTYNIVDFRDSIHAYTTEYDIKLKTKVVATHINENLYETIKNEDIDTGVAMVLAKKFAWTIDFFKFEKGDKFAIFLTEKYLNDSIFVGIEKINGAYFYTQGKATYGFPYQSNGDFSVEFYDENGKQMQTMFLKAPLRYYRITSKFSAKRFHPVLKENRAHHGTDYAAPTGTPIMTTADGIVIETGFNKGNGNYVKVKHNATYSTQYLHMSKILVKKGQRVSQGQTIGLVGSTGLATGPHVCYRFWKNGVQVNPLKINLPTSMSLESSEIPDFKKQITPIKDSLDKRIKLLK
ncbi:peptidoglycan DD-metalloendopeptidase family protein [Capnocytophaga sp. ARDL2]|uniref:M23 family metallopeptidase n=1 Tax=Capnocytophaga sp. ARDL2 TaxID=3238809 RepID=UPI003558F51C